MKPIYVPEGKLDTNQRRVYDLRENASFIVQGCAGSGKTSLAMLRMQQRLAKDRNSDTTKFYYIAYVRELVECIRRDIRNCPQMHEIAQWDDFLITLENWNQKEISDWMRNKCHVTPRPGMREEYEAESGTRTYRRVAVRINPRPEYLFVDECQDLTMDDIRDLVGSAKEGIAFYGDDAQHIMHWQGRSPVLLEDIQRAFPERFKEIHQLLFNYRLPKEIASFAQELGGRRDLVDHCKSKYHEKPIVRCFTEQELSGDKKIEYMASRIANWDLQDVAIVLPYNEAVRDYYGTLSRQLGGGAVSASWEIRTRPGEPRREGVHYSYLRDTRVKIMTYEKVKGQQFETVFLLVRGEMDAEDVERFYVGVTRAERFLYVLCAGSMPACLRSVPVDLYNTTDENIEPTGLYGHSEQSDASNPDTPNSNTEGEDW